MLTTEALVAEIREKTLAGGGHGRSVAAMEGRSLALAVQAYPRACGRKNRSPALLTGPSVAAYLFHPTLRNESEEATIFRRRRG